MKKSFKKLGFFSLVTSSVLLGSMNATDLQTYAALQKPSHVFGNYAEKDKDSKLTSDSPTQQQAQTQAQNTATTDSQTATTDETYTTSTDTTVAGAAKQVETDNTAVQNDEKTLKTDVAKVQADASTKDFDETTFKADQQAEQTAATDLQKAEKTFDTDQSTLNTDLQDQTKTPTPPAKKDETSGTPSASGSSVASQLTKDTTMVNNLKSVSVSGMNTTLSGVETMSKQTATISALLSGNPNLGSVISNAQGLSSAFSALESAQNTLKGYLNSSSATIGQLTNGSNAVVGALDKAINQVDMALVDLVTADTQKRKPLHLQLLVIAQRQRQMPSIS